EAWNAPDLYRRLVAAPNESLELIRAVDAQLLRRSPGQRPVLVQDVCLRPLEEILVLSEDQQQARREGAPGRRAEIEHVVAIGNARHAGELHRVADTVHRAGIVIVREERRVETKGLP